MSGTLRNRLCMRQVVGGILLAAVLPGAFAPRAEANLATGGTVTNFTFNGTNFTAHIFTNSGTFEVYYNADVEYLIVGGGGGGGGGYEGGGGGAGGMLTGIVAVTNGSFAVVVGGGGNGKLHPSSARNGTNSSFNVGSTITALGGGRGGSDAPYAAPQGTSSNVYGSGGGGCISGGVTGGFGTTEQGHNGGNGRTSSNYLGGGGGGAGDVGQPGTGTGLGGVGLTNWITGAAVVYANGGNGHARSGPEVGTAGTPNTGNGGNAGGGAANNSSSDGGKGGSGIVILRYVSPTIIRLNPANGFPFGRCYTNDVITNSLSISNDGIVPMTVSNIVFSDPGFSSSFITNLIIEQSTTQILSVFFQPLTNGPYAATLAIQCNYTAGSNSIALSGLGMENDESVSAPVVAGDAAGALGQTLAFSVSDVTNNWGETVEYRFCSSDGWTSAWSVATSTSHVWSAIGNYQISAQARCLTHPSVTSSWSSVTTPVNIHGIIFDFSTITNGQPFRATMTISDVDEGAISNSVFYFLPPLSTNTQPTNLTVVSGTNWTGTIPPLNAGNMPYYVQYMRSNIMLRYPASTNAILAITNFVGAQRQVSFEGGTWVNNGNDSADASSGWSGTSMNVALWAGFREQPFNNSANLAYLENVSGACIVSPELPTGIGTIYFQAGLYYNTLGLAHTIIAQVSTNDGADWADIQSFTLSPTGGGTNNADIHPAIRLNLRIPARVRIYQPAMAVPEQYVLIDNLIISPPPTDVQITEALMNPGYPNSKDPVLVRCQTADYANLVTGDIDAPSMNRRLSLWYKHSSATNYVSTNMTATGDCSYEVEVPTYPAGTMYYYFRCDFDGYFYTNSVITNTSAVVTNFLSEKISPSFLPDLRPGPVLATYPTPTTNTAFTYNIRQFRSEHQAVRIQPTSSSLADAMDLVDDYTWQGNTLITGTTNLSWFFAGDLPYSNNATAFGTTTSWGDTNQCRLHTPPMEGIADCTTNPLRAELAYNGALICRFVSTNANYLIRKGAYQNFENWQASPTYFEESWGADSAQTFTNYFTDWTNDFYPTNVQFSTGFSNETVSSSWYGTPHLIDDIHKAWSCINAQATDERNGNIAIRLNSGAAPGSLETTDKGVTEGLRTFTGRARLSQTDGRYAIYTKDLAGLDYVTNNWTNSYRMTNTVRAISMTPGTASLSTILCYRRDATNSMDLGSFYELRLTQHDESTLQMQMFRWNNGIMTDSNLENGGNGYEYGNALLTAPTPLQIDIAWTNSPGGVLFAGKIYYAGAPFPVFVLTTNVWKDTDARRIRNGGMVGFQCMDAEMEVRSLSVFKNATNLTSSIRFSETNFVPGSWYLGNTLDKPEGCWTITTVNGTNKLQRLLPAASSLGIDIIRTGTAGIFNNYSADWTSATNFSIAKFGYTNLTWQPNYWDQVYIRLLHDSGDLPIVVDDLSLSNWRGYTRGFVKDADATADGVAFWDWNDVRQQHTWSQTNSGWLVFEGMVTNASNPCVSLDCSRANTNLSQGVWSLMLTNGIGSIAFNATVAAGTSIYRVDYTDQDNPDGGWLPVQTFTNTVADGTVNRSVPVRMPGVTGRIRIIQVPTITTTNGVWIGGSSPNAILNLDNLEVRDYPPVDDGTWHAYNCLITSPSVNTSTLARAYEPTQELLRHQTCYLNNSATNGVQTPLDLSETNPYIQSPRLDTGIGEIAFWYRAWNSNATHISIQVAPDTSGPWTAVTNFTVTTTNYTYFDSGTSMYYPDDQIMRITVTNVIPSSTTGRLCVDNVLVAEPVFPSYSITDVALLPTQPLFMDQVGARATIDRLVMNPQGIRLFLSYIAGTNNWGYQNWWGSGTNPLPGVITVELSNSTDQVYVSSGANFIPPKNTDTIVQYVVWGTCSNNSGRPFIQGTNTFVNPSWYYPINQNATNASQGWSPYYYVYSCPPGSVWINEINYALLSDESANEYIELIGPTNVNIGNWKIDLLNQTLNRTDGCTVSNNFIFANVTNGWGFFVYGDVNVSHMNQHFAAALSQNIPTPGAARLVRSMGAWEDLVCWSDASLTNYGCRYAGHKDYQQAAPLHLQGGAGSNKYDFSWNQPSSGNYTPGAPNHDQILHQAPVIPFFLYYYYLTSIVGLHGTHSCNASVTQLTAGASTSVTYTADSWYRIQTFTSDNMTNLAAVGTSQLVWVVTNISQNISNNASFCLLPDDVELNVPTWWLAAFGMAESAAFDDDPFSIRVEYLLNMNPYVSNTVSFTVASFGVTGANVNVTAKLLESSNGVDFCAQTNIYGTLYVQGTTNLSDGTWSNVTSQPPPHVFDTNGQKVFSFPVNTNTFYRADIQ